MANPVLTKQFGEPAASDAALQTTPPPATTATGEKRMTIGSVAAATFFLLVLVVAGAAYGWANAVAVQRWYWLFIIGLLVLVFATVARPRLAPITGIVYSLGQGALVGSISKIYETFYEGIVFLALTATVAVFVGALLLYVFRIIKVTQKDPIGDHHRHSRNRSLLSRHVAAVDLRRQRATGHRGRHRRPRVQHRRGDRRRPEPPPRLLGDRARHRHRGAAGRSPGSPPSG